MILKALIVLEIAAAGILGGWLLLFTSPTEPPQVTPITINEAPVAIPTQSTMSPTTTQTIVIPIPTPIPQVDPQITAPVPTIAPPQTIYIPIYVPQTAPAPHPQPEQPLPTAPQPTMTTIEIISPIAGKGLGRTYTAQPEIIDESNYIEIGIVARTNDGLVHSDLVVTITATDESQNKILNGTGITTKIYKNGIPETVLYYPFHYEFKTVGDHTITFSVPGVDPQSVTLTVTAPDPA